MNRKAAASPSREAKELFLACRQLPDDLAAQELLASVDPTLAEEVRGLLRSLESGKVIDRVLEISDAPELELTTDGGQQADTGDLKPYVGERPGMRIGNYKLLETIGEGGMGTVFMAQQDRPVKRKVAVKVVKPGMDSRQVVARFEAERQALAMMDHPNIARVFDGGSTEQGRPFFVMELVKGVPLTDFCERRQLTIRDRLRLFIDVCHGVQHAHQRGIIHRDLKPSNVMVTLHDDRPVVKIIDFGIAKAMNAELTDKTLFTQFAALVGTPLYMSPEQAELSGLDVDTRSDVYSLGVMLYELLTGTTPFDRETLKTKGLDEVRQMIRETEPPRPSQRISTVKAAGETGIDLDKLREIKRSQSELSSELDWIVMRAIEKDRQRRYQSASQFEDDVQRFLDGDAVEACPPSLSYRFRKSFNRYRLFYVAAGLVLLTAALGTTVSLLYANRARVALVEATNAERRAEASAKTANDFAAERDHAAQLAEVAARKSAKAEARERRQRSAKERQLYETSIKVVAAQLDSELDFSALDRLMSLCPIGSNDDLRGWEWFYLLGLTRTPVESWSAHQGGGSIKWSRNGNSLFTSTSDGTKCWDANTLELRYDLVGTVLDPTDRWLASAVGRVRSQGEDYNSGAIGLFSLEKNAAEVVAVPNATVIWGHPVFSTKGDRFVANDNGNDEGPVGSLYFFAENDGTWGLEDEIKAAGSRPIGWSPDERWFADASRNKLKLRDGHDLVLDREFVVPQLVLGMTARPGRWHPSRNQIALLLKDGGLLIHDIETDSEPHRIECREPLKSCEWSPDGRWIAAGSRSGRLYLWNTDEWSGQSFLAHARSITGIAWSPDSLSIASMGADGQASIWSVQERSEESSDRLVAGDRNGNWFWVDDGSIRLLIDREIVMIDSRNGETKSRETLPRRPSWELSSGRVAARRAPNMPDQPLEIYDVISRELTMVAGFAAQLRGPFRASVSPSGRRLAFSVSQPFRYDEPVSQPSVIDLATGSVLNLQISELVQCNKLAWSPEGSSIALTGGISIRRRAPFVHVFDASTGELKTAFKVGDDDSTNLTNGLAWGPEGDRLAVAVDDGYCEVVDLQEQSVAASARIHIGNVRSMDWHPHEDRVASGGDDGFVRVWDPTSGAALLSLHLGEPVTQVQWSTDGTQLAASTLEGSIHVWDSRPGVKVSQSKGFNHLRERHLVDEAYRAFQTSRQDMRNGREIQAVDRLAAYGDWKSESNFQSDFEKRRLLFVVGSFHYYRSIIAEQENDAKEMLIALEEAQKAAPDSRSVIDRIISIDREQLRVPYKDRAIEEYLSAQSDLIETLEAKHADAHPKWGFNKSILASRLAGECNYLAEFLNDNGLDVQRTLELARRATELEPEKDTHWNTLAVAFARLGDFSNAAKTQERIIELRPEDESARNTLNEYRRQALQKRPTN